MNFKTSVVALVLAAVAVFLGAPNASAESKSVTIQEGDTLSSIADTNGTTYVRIFNANEALVSPDVINAGDSVRIPDENEQLPDRYSEYQAALATYVAPVVETTTYSQPTAGYQAITPAYSYTGGSTTGNTYAWGNCTWYAKDRRSDLPNMLGNGGSWVGSAAAQGYATGSTPQAGAIAEIPGHVMYVEGVNGDGSVNISEMNYNGGVGQVNYRTVSASSIAGYIY